MSHPHPGGDCVFRIPFDCDFSYENLPFGIYSTANNARPRIGVAIHDKVLDLNTIKHLFFSDEQSRKLQSVFESSSLNDFLLLGPTAWRLVRERLLYLLRRGVETFRGNYDLWEKAFTPIKSCEMHLPIDIKSLVHFEACETHIRNVRKLLNDADSQRQQTTAEDSIPPAWYTVPLARDGCPSAVSVGKSIRRPHGLRYDDDHTGHLTFGPTRQLDCQVELGLVVGGQPRVLSSTSSPILIDDTPNHIFGCVLVTNWVARDFVEDCLDPVSPDFGLESPGQNRPISSRIVATSCSPWVVTLDALMPFMTDGDVQRRTDLLSHLRHDESFFLNAQIRLAMRPAGCSTRAKVPISRVNTRSVYWSMKQQLSHRSLCAWPLHPGDLLTTGAISDGWEPNRVGTFLEATRNGREPITLQSGSQTYTRRFVEDGDEVTVSGHCEGEGYRVGFGESSIIVKPAVPIY